MYYNQMTDAELDALAPRRHCPQCDREVRVTEPYAFGGRDRLRSTLACGHVVLR